MKLSLTEFLNVFFTSFKVPLSSGRISNAVSLCLNAVYPILKREYLLRKIALIAVLGVAHIDVHLSSVFDKLRHA